MRIGLDWISIGRLNVEDNVNLTASIFEEQVRRVA